MEETILDAEERMQKSVSTMVEEFAAIRSGRASAALFDKIRIEYYGEPTPLNQVATVSVPEARLVVIQPWDKSVIGAIEKAIQKSELSVNPSNDGKVIRINIPPLTEDRRKEIVKMAKNTAEQARIAIRNIRRDANDQLKKAQKDGEITEDDIKRGEDEVQKLTDSFVEKVDAALAAKEKEILEV
ncbi:MAG: ribosome recycling factor [Spirochaetaceae bacterium]|nr:MAG: ribosome recycling factor [Spirochaetaceae bacterium]